MDPFIVVGIVLVGAFAGCRSMTPPAIVAWGVHLGNLSLHHSRLGWVGSWPAVILLTLGALGELVGDKLPNTPSRTLAGPFIFRIIVGAFCGAVLANAASEIFWMGAIPGAVGAVLGTLGGYQLRTRLVKALKCPDWPVALTEDLLVIAGTLLVVTRY